MVINSIPLTRSTLLNNYCRLIVSLYIGWCLFGLSTDKVTLHLASSQYIFCDYFQIDT